MKVLRLFRALARRVSWPRPLVADGATVPDGVPILTAYRAGDASLIVWCDWCRRWHSHGSAGDGHRVGHCACQLSPYRATGYLLLRVDEEAPVRRQAREHGCGPGAPCAQCPARRAAA